MTYTYDPTQIAGETVSRARFELGDTQVDGGSETCFLSDEEIAAVIASTPRWKRALFRLADAVCMRLSFETDRETVIQGSVNLIRKVRTYNPEAKIVWILPGTECHPDLAEEAVHRVQAEGMKEVYSFAMPDYSEEETGARWHPNAEYNRKVGIMLGEFLKEIQNSEFIIQN